MHIKRSFHLYFVPKAPVLLLLIALYLFAPLSLTAQQNPNLEKLAATYYAAGEFQKARDTYEELLKNNRYTAAYHDNYLNCLIKLEEYKTALKFTQKQAKSFPDNPAMQVDMGWIYEKAGDIKKANQVFEQIIGDKKMYLAGRAPNAANSFYKRNYIDNAIQVYLNARTFLSNSLAYSMELAEMYAIKGDYSLVFDEYLQYLEVNAGYYEQVKQRLTLYLNADEQRVALKNALLIRLQKNPHNAAYQELLFWNFVQLKDWNSAFVQLRALDVKTGNTGSRLLELAKVCVENEAYDIAIKTYENLTQRGSSFPLYNMAFVGLLNARLLIIQKGAGSTNEDLFALEAAYLKFLDERGHLPGADNARLDLASLYIFYLKKVEKGIEVLVSLSNSSQLGVNLKGKAKIMLADAYLMNGQDWDAHLIYKQVEKEFKDEAIGQEARFNYARLCYFRGEFDWALTQLEVLKGATSQLIANNAIELALHIIESSGLDSTEEALAAFAHAEYLVFQQRFIEADSVLDDLKSSFTFHELSDNILFLKAKIAQNQGDIVGAVAYYKQLVKQYYFGLLADDALIQLGRIHELRLKDIKNALTFYEKLLFDFPASFFTYEARNRYRNLKEGIKPN